MRNDADLCKQLLEAKGKVDQARVWAELADAQGALEALKKQKDDKATLKKFRVEDEEEKKHWLRKFELPPQLGPTVASVADMLAPLVARWESGKVGAVRDTKEEKKDENTEEEPKLRENLGSSPLYADLESALRVQVQRAVLRGSTNTLDDLAAAFAYTHGAAADAALPALR